MSVKDKVLSFLLDAETVSGGRMAKELGVSRNSIWKAVANLKREGYLIESAQSSGYRLIKIDSLSEQMIRARLKSKTLGRKIEIHHSLPSTNTYAKQLALRDGEDGTVIIAESQTAGRGRRGRSFFSPTSGIYMSILLRPEFSAETAGLVTSCAAVATAKAIERLCDCEIGIKWVNDLLANGKKLCGILCEGASDLESGCMEYMIIGIGINVGATEFPPELCDIATTLENICGKKISRNELIAEILNSLEEEIASIESGAFIEESRRRSVVIGKDVTVISGGNSYPASAIDIDDKGHLLIEKDGKIIPLFSGEVSIRV